MFLKKKDMKFVFSYVNDYPGVKIAKKLGRSHLTIVREINRNWKDDWFYRIKYNPEEAQLKYRQRLQKWNFNIRIFIKDEKKEETDTWLTEESRWENIN